MKIIVTESQLDRALSESPNEVKALINPTQPFDMGSMEKGKVGNIKDDKRY
jgi:hypothetical protein